LRWLYEMNASYMRRASPVDAVAVGACPSVIFRSGDARTSAMRR
jgi:hypothetical protein